MKTGRKAETFQEHKAYMEKTVPILMAAEKTVDEIKNSKEWKRHFNYFQTLYNRGHLLERPTKQNGYKIIVGDPYVKLGTIEDLLTPEQIEKIKERMK